MKAKRLSLPAVGIAVLLLLLVPASVPAVPARVRAAQSPAITPQWMAMREAVSPATGHLFVLSQASWYPIPSVVSMLDARTGTLLHTTPVGHFAQWLLVDDAAQRVFVVNGGVLPDKTSEPVRVLALDSRTGALLRTTDLGPGQVGHVDLASTLGQLFVTIEPGPITSAPHPEVVRVLDTGNGGSVHTLQLQAGDQGGVVHEAAHSVLVFNESGTIRIYDSRTWRSRGTAHVNSPRLGVADEVHGVVAIVSGQASTSVTFVDPVAGAVSGTVTLKSSSQLVNLVLDDETDHLFGVFFGGWGKLLSADTSALSITGGDDGAVTTIDRASHAVLQIQPVGLMAVRAAVDPKTHHLFVLSGARVGTQHGRLRIASSLLTTLDTRTGMTVHATTLPYTDVQDVADIAVDSQVGRAYVNFAGGPAKLNSVTLLDTLTGAIVRTVVLPESRT